MILFEKNLAMNEDGVNRGKDKGDGGMCTLLALLFIHVYTA